MRSIGREIATNPRKKPVRVPPRRYFRYFRLRQSQLYLHRPLLHIHIHTHVHTATVHFPPTVLFHPTSIFSANLLPGATLFVTITQTTCLHLTLYFCMRACAACTYVSVKRLDVCAPSYNSAQICLNKGGTESSEYHGGLNWTPLLTRLQLRDPLYAIPRQKVGVAAWRIRVKYENVCEQKFWKILYFGVPGLRFRIRNIRRKKINSQITGASVGCDRWIIPCDEEKASTLFLRNERYLKFLRDVGISLLIPIRTYERKRERERRGWGWKRSCWSFLISLAKSLATPHPTPMRSRSLARVSIRDCSRMYTGRVIDNKLMATFVKRTANVGAIQSYVDDNFRSP